MSELLNQLAEEFEDSEYAHVYLEENSNMRIAAQVRALRIQRNWSQQDLAERAGMKQARISKIEAADFESLSLTTLRRLAAAFDVALNVKFDSVFNVIGDFINLSATKLVCEDRVASIERMSKQSNSALVLPPTRAASPRPATLQASSVGGARFSVIN